MKGLAAPIILQIVGVAVIIVEIIIPSGGVLSILAALIFGYSLFIVFTELSTTVGMFFVAADIIIIPVLVYVGLRLLAKSPVTLHATLASEHGVTSQDATLADYAGKTGIAKSNLRPAGIAVIEGKRVDVVTRGEYIPIESPITVHRVTGNQIIVRASKEEA
jgi:membrane-bound ClpP family serine protease